MSTKIVIPEMGESVTEGVIASWHKQDGDMVDRDEHVMDLETDKITLEVRAPAAGRLSIAVKEGERVEVGQTVGSVDESASVGSSSKAGAARKIKAEDAGGDSSRAADATTAVEAKPVSPAERNGAADEVRATPLARKIGAEHGIDLSSIRGSGAGGRVREQDVLEHVKSKSAGTPAKPTSEAAKPAAEATRAPAGARGVRREPMSMLRQRIATRLVEAQHTAAMLTTFNEVDMSAVMDLRKKYKDSFEKKHGIGLGFMSFFVKAVVGALKSYPLVNASIVQGEKGDPQIEHHDFQDIAIAVGTPKGLVVPVLRDCDRLSFAEIETGIKDLAMKAKDGKLSLADLQGGTFTITNGGIYGSLMSTPILNPPQSGILGMHAIKNRAVEDPDRPGQVAIRPMMYLALSYDHRIIDGAEAVQFLVAVRDAIEHPERLLIGL